MTHSAIRALYTVLDHFAAGRDELVSDGMEPAEADYVLNPVHDTILTTTVQAVLFTCLWIEGTVNTYGTLALGEPFFRQHIEKLTIISKLALVIAIRKQRLLAAESEVVRTIGNIFEARNRLVHRKTREIDIANINGHAVSSPSPRGLADLAQTSITLFRSLVRELENGDETMLVQLGER